MSMIRRILCVLLSLALLLGGFSLAEPAENGTDARAQAARATLLDGACTDQSVSSFDDAFAVIGSVMDDAASSGRIQLEPWRMLTDACGNRYYVFQQMYDNTTVLGGAVKVMTDSEGKMLGMNSSLVTDLPVKEPLEGITAQQAEQLTLEHAMQTSQQALTVVEGLTARMILPLILETDMEADEEEGSRYVWVVYTDNPGSRQAQTPDLPYLAHYVTLEGEYLYSLPTMMPGDEAGASGFDASYVFEFMEPVEYTGYVDLSTGSEQEITVEVMRDKRTGMYYLGNLERRIVVADCWEFLYNGNRVVLQASPDNMEWDQVGLLTLYNYCRAYDYYREIGWVGGDGLGTPILILNDFCDANHTPVDNAAYVGGYLGWQIFLASRGNDLSQCLDVLAHEYTHCVTGSVMTYNAYMNDYGAINEAISDIQGKTCQMLMEGAENTSWVLADRSLTPVRSLSEPHRFQQPEFTWDVYYVPGVRTPTVLNDQGGVHSNSSLLNYLAWRLYEKGGMSLEEGRSFWFTVDCAMVPGTDYAQLTELLPWALRATGLEKYDTELQRALDATRLGTLELPSVFDDDRALLTLTLPQNQVFDDEQWILYVFSLDMDKLLSEAGDIISSVIAGDYSVLPPLTRQLLIEALSGQEKTELLDKVLSSLSGREAGEAKEGSSDMLGAISSELIEWAMERLQGVFYMASTNAGQDGRTMRMVCLPGLAVPVLIHGVYNEATSDLDETCVLACIGGTWVDMNSLLGMVDQLEGDKIPDEMQAYIDQLVEGIVKIGSLDDLLDLFFYRIRGGEINRLPAAGLEEIQPEKSSLFSNAAADGAAAEIAEPKKSRPKLDDTPAAPQETVNDEAADAE